MEKYYVFHLFLFNNDMEKGSSSIVQCFSVVDFTDDPKAETLAIGALLVDSKKSRTSIVQLVVNQIHEFGGRNV